MKDKRQTLHTPSPVKRSTNYGVGRDEYVSWSVKGGRSCRFFSSTMYQKWLLCEWDPNIQALCEYPDSGKVPLAQGRSRQLALWTRAIDGTEQFWDVTTNAEVTAGAGPSDAPAHWPAVESWSRQHGCRVQLLKPRDLVRYRQRLENLMQLHAYAIQAQAKGRTTLEDAVSGILHIEEPVTVAELCGLFPEVESTELVAALAALVYRGAAVADLDNAPIGRYWAIRRAANASPAIE